MSNQNPLIGAFNALHIIQCLLGISNLMKIQRNRLLYVCYVVLCSIISLLLFGFCLINILREADKKSLVSQIMEFLTICSLEAATVTFYYQSIMCNLFSNQRHVFEILNLIDSEFYTQLKEILDYTFLKRIVNKSVAFSVILVSMCETLAIFCYPNEYLLNRIHRFISLFTFIIGNNVFIILVRELLRRMNLMNRLSDHLYRPTGNRIDLKVHLMQQIVVAYCIFFHYISEISTNSNYSNNS